jgi:hypothetical protein
MPCLPSNKNGTGLALFMSDAAIGLSSGSLRRFSSEYWKGSRFKSFGKSKSISMLGSKPVRGFAARGLGCGGIGDRRVARAPGS